MASMLGVSRRLSKEEFRDPTVMWCNYDCGDEVVVEVEVVVVVMVVVEVVMEVVVMEVGM